MVESVHLDTTGPLFRPDRQKTMEQNVRRMIVGLALEGERMVKAGWTNSANAAGHGRGGVIGRAYSLRGKPWRFVATVTPGHWYDWPGGGDKRYRGGRDKVRKRAFASAKARIRHARPGLLARVVEGLE